MELELDFSEEDVEFADRHKLSNLLAATYVKIKDLAAGQQSISCDDEVPAADNMGEEAVRSDFAAERRMLDSI